VLVEHMILSHHGELEFGSPKLPQFPEALLLHHLDNLDSKMECMRALVAKDRLVEGFWTGYNASLERSVLKKAKYLEEEPASPAPTSTASTSRPAAPPPPPAPVPQRETRAEPTPHPPAPVPQEASSHFAEKLGQAWRKGS
jgi:3'-5' exoribonuclease